MFGCGATKDTTWSVEFGQCHSRSQVGLRTNFRVDLQKGRVLEQDLYHHGSCSRMCQRDWSGGRIIAHWSRTLHHGVLYEHFRGDFSVHFVSLGFVLANSDNEQA